MDAVETTGLTELKNFLGHSTPGEITDTSEIEPLLAVAWNDLAGDFGGMRPDKLFGRMEDVTWTPPLLTFRIERHGATVMGSSRAEMQAWTIDVEKGTACCEAKGYRQLSPRQPPLDVKPLVDEVAAAIVNHADEPRLKWVDQETVRVKIGLIFSKGSAVKMTLAGRRKRFQMALAERLATKGWVQVGANKYQLREILG
ncbi:MAG: hypothetical protein HYX68_16155 [Planctomycetes bacterium]|nr:hypothetical protein [Planctomycetota bacterium]